MKRIFLPFLLKPNRTRHQGPNIICECSNVTSSVLFPSVMLMVDDVCDVALASGSNVNVARSVAHCDGGGGDTPAD